MTKNLRILPLAGAIALLSGNAMANEAPEPTDILTDGWEVNGYIRASWRVDENGTSTSNEYGKPDYNLAATTGKNPNQVEFNISKNTAFQNGVWSQLGVRAEYGNGDSSFYSSTGSEDSNNRNEGPFEVKEAYLRLGGLSYLPEDADIWAGRRFLNRAAGLLSGEFWKQSSGVGFGYEQNSSGIAVVSVDPGEKADKPDGKTLHSIDLYSYNHEALGGSFNFDVKFMMAGDKDKYTDKEATDGIGAAITYNGNYYGLDGWTTTALAYGRGLAANRGVNFGQWSGGTSTVDSDKGNSIFFTSYGVLNINDRWQMASEVTYLHGEKIWGLGSNPNADGDTVDRLLIALRPSYMVNDNFRWEFTASYGFEKDYWGDINLGVGNVENKTNIYAAEIAAVFTVNSDYFGRPQIKPFVTFMSKDSSNEIIDKDGWGEKYGKDKSTYQFGVEGEIWF
ncbi:carbohydrate porin [Thalassotalea sp. G20_0]|uniref:carbohydrate porin n=1 Tax=Thalassotalea sp. G20_0 TaxID=2821093 RepID=UPI001ADAA2FA|nr:carbohydrate porin [Thalassotalea sp. G20_0]